MSASADPIFQVGGALLANSPVYIQRTAEVEAIMQLRKMSYLMFIESRQQGKTSLINWVNGHLYLMNYSFAIADISTLDHSSEANWYTDLSERLLHQLDFFSDKEVFHLPTTPRTWRRFLADLSIRANKAGRRLVIALDEIGTQKQTWTEAFFRILRDVFNSRQNEPHFNHLTFILAGRYNHTLLIHHPDESPFNVAVRIRLNDFTKEQTSQLVAHLPASSAALEQITQEIYYWADGQPYLTQWLCYYFMLHEQVLHSRNINQAVQSLCHEDRSHLPPILNELKEKVGLQRYVELIPDGHRARFTPHDDRHVKLEFIGIIKVDSQGYCIIRNPIYKQAFTASSEIENVIENEVNELKDIKIFISYARTDERLFRGLIAHLRGLERLNLIKSWHSLAVTPGTEWTTELMNYLNTAQIILLLISPDFINSDYCYTIEMQQAMEKYKQGKVLVIPIIIRPSAWEKMPFGELQALPTNKVPVTSWKNRDEAFLSIVEGIQKQVLAMQR